MGIARLSISYDSEQKEALQVAAKAENRKLSQLVQLILSEWIRNNPEKCGIEKRNQTKRRK